MYAPFLGRKAAQIALDTGSPTAQAEGPGHFLWRQCAFSADASCEEGATWHDTVRECEEKGGPGGGQIPESPHESFYAIHK